MADRAQLSEAIDQAIRALEELKRVWEAQEETAPPQQAPSWQTAPPRQTPSWQSAPPVQQDRNQQMAVPPFRAEGRTCPVCGTKVGAQSKFCKECGSVIP